MHKVTLITSYQVQQTAKVAVGNASQTLSEMGVTISKPATAEGDIPQHPIGAFITVEDNDVQWGMGAVTNEAGTDVGHEAGAQDIVRLNSKKEVQSAEFINKVSGVVANLQVSVLY